MPVFSSHSECQLHPHRRDHPISRAAAAVREVPVFVQVLRGCSVHHGGQHGPHPALGRPGRLRRALLEPRGEKWETAFCMCEIIATLIPLSLFLVFP